MSTQRPGADAGAGAGAGAGAEGALVRARSLLSQARRGRGALGRRDLDRLGHPRLPRATRACGPRTRPPRSRPTLQAYMSDPESTVAEPLTSPIWESLPNAGHLALADLRSGRLHTRRHPEHRRAAPGGRGLDPALIVEIHGTTCPGGLDGAARRLPPAGRGGAPACAVRRGGSVAPKAWDGAVRGGHLEVGHHQFRPEPGAGGPLPSRVGGGRVRPAAGRRDHGWASSPRPGWSSPWCGTAPWW